METLIQNDHLTRQSAIIDSDTIKKLPIMVIGCGAVGSFAVLALAKMGAENIVVYDGDDVDIVNMNNQFYRFKDIGMNKAVALRALVHDFTGIDIKAHNTFATPETLASFTGVVISAVDSMKVRSQLFRECVDARWWIDPRMSAEKYNQYVVDMRSTTSRDSYLKTLYTDSEAVSERCTAKSTIYTALVSASMICKAVKNLVMREPYPKSVLMDLQKSSNNVVMFQ